MVAAKSWFCELAIFSVAWRSGREPWVGTHASRGNGQQRAAFLSISCQVPDAKHNYPGLGLVCAAQLVGCLQDLS